MQAVKGVSSVYYAYPVQDGLGDATAAMAYAAKEEGISRVVNLVMFQSSTEAPTPRMRQNFLSEQVFAWAGVGEVHIRATVFYENLARLVREPAREGRDPPALGETKFFPSSPAKTSRVLPLAC